MEALLWLEFLLFLTFLSACSLAFDPEETCYKFARTNVGSIAPNHFDRSIAVGSTFELRCSLDGKFARERSLSAAHISWQKNTLDIATDNPRISITAVDGQTSVIKVENAGVGDSGSYRCMVPMNATKQFICSVTARIAEPPKKYVNFTCVSNLMEDLICSWKRPDVPAPNSAQVNYTMKYHLLGKTVADANPCPEPHPPGRRNGQNREVYGCSIRFRTKEAREAEAKKNNGTVAPPYMSQYVHIITITASNDLYSESWTENIDPRKFTNPGAPSSLTASALDANTCHLEWTMSMGITSDHKGFDFEIDYRKNDSELDAPWTQDLNAYENMKGQSPLENAHMYKGGTFWYDVWNLVAYSNYTFRVHAFPTGANNGSWGNYTYTTCLTPTAVPSGKPGVVPGAYEERSGGIKREVDVYWKGVPKELQNGPYFLYRIHGLGDHGEVKWTAKTDFNNYRVSAPYNETVRIKIIPVNNMSRLDVSDYSEVALIPPVSSAPLKITHTNMEILKDSTYEVYWETNEPADEFQIFHCPTSLDPHMGKCTAEMSVVSIGDPNVRSYLLKLDAQHQHYRFAVSANRKKPDGSIDYSGMSWVRYLCREQDSRYGLDDLTVDQLANTSVEVNWVVPCHRFMQADGFRINYSPCPAENQSACLQNEVLDVPFNTSGSGPPCLRSTVLPTLQPGTRYCFSVSITSSASEANSGYSVYQCIMTAPPPTPLPIVRIVVGSVVAALALVIICFVLWRAFKRMRRTFKEIEKASKNIVLPTKPAFPGNHTGTHYTTVEGDDTGSYLRQQSEGIGSLAPEDMGKVTPFISFTPEKMFSEHGQSLKTGRNTGSTPLVARLSQSMLDLESTLSAKRSGSVPGVAHLAVSRQSLAATKRPLGSSEDINLVMPRSGSVGTEVTGLNSLGSSGVESDAPPSSGYVAAESFSQPNQSTASSREQTGDTGYVSQPASNYGSSAAQHSVLGGTTSGSSGFSEISNSPDHGSDGRPEKIWEKPQRATERPTDGEGDGVQSPLLPKEVTTTQLSSSNRISKAPVTQPLATGYVAWP